MSKPRKLTLKTSHDHKGKRLDQVLSEWLPQALSQPLSKGKVRKLIVAGGVYLNGRRVRIASKELQANAKVDVYVDLQKLLADQTNQDKPFELTQSHVLYEDEYIIALNKPPGLPTQPTLDEARDNLFAAVKRFLKKRSNEPEPYVGLHHRLDRDTSGVVLFTKKVEANAGVAELFSKHLAVKTYHCLTQVPEASQAERRLSNPQWEIKNYLAKDKGKSAKMQAVRSGGDFAHTEFKLLESHPTGWWVEARPKTGRTHQIRVHLSGDGMSILGDATYGDRRSAVRLMLHAVNLTFPHPISKLLISVDSTPPEDFNQCLSIIRRHREKSALGGNNS